MKKTETVYYSERGTLRYTTGSESNIKQVIAVSLAVKTIVAHTVFYSVYSDMVRLPQKTSAFFWQYYLEAIKVRKQQ